MRSRTIGLIVLAAALASFARADDAPDEALFPGESASGIVARGDERSVRFAGLAGVRWTVSVQRAAGSAANPRLALRAPSGEEVSAGRALQVTHASSTIRNLRLRESGVWSAVVSTPSDGGVVLSIQAKPPARVRLRGRPVAGSAAFEREAALDLLRGSALDLEVRVPGRPRRGATASFVAPDGTTLAETDFVGGVAFLPGVVTQSSGVHRVVVRGASARRFGGTARIAPPPPREALLMGTFEPLPVPVSISPRTVMNGTTRTFVLYGEGFSTAQQIELRHPEGSTLLPPDISVHVSRDSYLRAVAVIDLGDLRQGTYAVDVTLGDRRVRFPHNVTVGDLPASIASVTPAETPNGQELDVSVLGAGFDPGATFAMVRTSDGISLPFMPGVTRVGADELRRRLYALAGFGGLFGVVVTDGSGTQLTLPGAFDLLGTASSDVRVRAMARQSDDLYDSSLEDAAYDPVTDTIVVAVTEPDTGDHGRRAAFVQCNARTLEVVGEFRAPQDDATAAAKSPAASFHLTPRVVFHPVDRTWAMTWVNQVNLFGAGGQQTGTEMRGHFRVAKAASVTDEVRSAELTRSPSVTALAPVADLAGGGWLAAWTELSPSNTTVHVRTLPLRADGEPDAASPASVHAETTFTVSAPVCAQRADGKFVVAYALVEAGGPAGKKRSLVRRVVGRDGEDEAEPLDVVKDVETSHLPAALVARADGSLLLALTRIEVAGYSDGSPKIRSLGQCVVLSGEDASPGAVRHLGEPVSSLVWNEARSEFVVALFGVDETTGGSFVRVRRLAADGTPKSAVDGTVEGYDGGKLWAGGDGALGLVRRTDGVLDGTTPQVPGGADVFAVRLR